MDNIFISIQQALPRVPGLDFVTPFNFDIKEGECWTFYGKNGSGKSIISEVISGRYGLKSGTIQYPFLDPIKAVSKDYVYPRQYIHTVSFQSTYSISDFPSRSEGEAYYQQRFNSQDVERYPTVREVLMKHVKNSEELNFITNAMSLSEIVDNSMITLSSGQLRRLLIAIAVADRPKMMVFDNPYIGLDVETRNKMADVFKQLMKEGIQLVFLIPTLRDIPECTTHVLYLDSCKPIFAGTYSDFCSLDVNEDIVLDSVFDFSKLNSIPCSESNCVVDMEHVDIKYGSTYYQRDLDWHIAKGEKWALLGKNGSGKSTLLSMIFADNPAGYSKELWLFGRKRGTGESIWDIKKHIGYTSSEMHLYYIANVSCKAVVESGFFDSVGLYRKCTEEQSITANLLLDYLGLTHLADKSFMKISQGEQRLILFARALVKNPQCLILDEPFHGMDYAHKKLCFSLIDSFASQADRSIIFVTHYREEIPSVVDHIKQLS